MLEGKWHIYRKWLPSRKWVFQFTTFIDIGFDSRRIQPTLFICFNSHRQTIYICHKATLLTSMYWFHKNWLVNFPTLYVPLNHWIYLSLSLFLSLSLSLFGDVYITIYSDISQKQSLYITGLPIITKASCFTWNYCTFPIWSCISLLLFPRDSPRISVMFHYLFSLTSTDLFNVWMEWNIKHRENEYLTIVAASRQY